MSKLQSSVSQDRIRSKYSWKKNDVVIMSEDNDEELKEKSDGDQSNG